MLNDTVARLISAHARGAITGRELVNATFSTLAHDGRFDQVNAITLLLLERAEPEVKEWPHWVEGQFQSNPLWVPFHFGGQFTAEELEELAKPARSNFRQLSFMVQAILDQHSPGCSD